MTGPGRHAPQIVLACGALTIAISLGIRHGFGLFLQPVSMEGGWGREVFALAIAVQNLVWGIAQPVMGLAADRFGAGKVVLVGALLYALGLVMMAQPQGAAGFVLSAGLLVGLGLGGTAFPIVFGAIGRAVSPERRSRALGTAMAVGSFGQFVMLPGTLGLMEWIGWSGALAALALVAGATIPLAVGLFERPAQNAPVRDVPARAAVREALGHPDFRLLALGFFVCGFQVVFIGTHLPAFLADKGLPLSVGTTVLALVGLANVAGCYVAGLWGDSCRKPLLLAGIYLARAVAIAAFVLLPVSEWSAYAFGIAMGLFWLNTAPLTNGTIASLFGVGNLSMLGGVVFLAHQLGSFLGGWLGGYFYDRFGSYDAVWFAAIGLSLAASALNLPISERRVTRIGTEEARA